MKIALAQHNYQVGDFAGNLAKIADSLARAAAQGAALAIFSELALPGYYPGDLLNQPDFLRAQDEAFARLRQLSRQWPALHIAIGLARPNHGPGKPLFNSAAVLRDGEVVAQYDKQLLPTYDVFDERRHFEPGKGWVRAYHIAGARVAFLICEDGWNDTGDDYEVNPFAAVRQLHPDLVVSLNASPSSLGKRLQRHTLFTAASRDSLATGQPVPLPLVWVNQVGGQDAVVFDGASFALEPDHGVVFEAASFAEDFAVIEFANGKFVLDSLPPAGHARASEPCRPDVEVMHEHLVLGVRDYARRCGFKTAVVGASGGIDSAVTLAIAVEALGAANVRAIGMPSRYSSPGSEADAHRMCRRMAVPFTVHGIQRPVSDFEEGFQQAFGVPLHGVAAENLQARLRGVILMEYSNQFGALLLSTGNKSELSVGYCTLYGDTNGGLAVLGDLYKTEVYALATYINQRAGQALIPQVILDKAPSAELAPGQQDSDSLPPYPVLDAILQHLLEGTPANRLPAEATPALVQQIAKLIAKNEYKRRQAPPVIRLRPQAFGAGRQVPLTAAWPLQ